MLSAGEEGAGRCQDQSQLRPPPPSSTAEQRGDRSHPQDIPTRGWEQPDGNHGRPAPPGSSTHLAGGCSLPYLERWEERHGDSSATCSKTQLAATALEADLLPRTTQLLVDGHGKLGEVSGQITTSPATHTQGAAQQLRRGLIPQMAQLKAGSGSPQASERGREQGHSPSLPSARATSRHGGRIPARILAASGAMRTHSVPGPLGCLCPTPGPANLIGAAAPSLQLPTRLSFNPGSVQPGFPAHTGAVPGGTRCPPVGTLPPTCCYSELRLPAPSLQAPTPYVPTGVSSEPFQCCSSSSAAILQQSPARWCPAAARTPPAPQPFRSSPGGLFLHPQVPPDPQNSNQALRPWPAHPTCSPGAAVPVRGGRWERCRGGEPWGRRGRGKQQPPRRAATSKRCKD